MLYFYRLFRRVIGTSQGDSEPLLKKKHIGVFLREPNGSETPLQAWLEHALNKEGARIVPLNARIAMSIAKGNGWQEKLATHPFHYVAIGLCKVSHYEVTDAQLAPKGRKFTKHEFTFRFFDSEGYIVGAYSVVIENDANKVLNEVYGCVHRCVQDFARIIGQAAA